MCDRDYISLTHALFFFGKGIFVPRRVHLNELFSFNVEGWKSIDHACLVDAAVVFESDVLPSLETFG